MKTLRTIAVALILAFTTGSAFAAGSTDLTVQATVLGTCAFDAAAYTMDFGQLDPAAAADTTVNATIDFTCSNGTPFTIDNIAGARSMVGGVTAANLPYSIAAYANTGTGTGLLQSLVLAGTVLAADYDVASGLPADAYTEVITINITP